MIVHQGAIDGTDLLEGLRTLPGAISKAKTTCHEAGKWRPLPRAARSRILARAFQLYRDSHSTARNASWADGNRTTRDLASTLTPDNSRVRNSGSLPTQGDCWTVFKSVEHRA
jgi:hypothetical protein